MHLFPFEAVEKGSRIVIYGAGGVGREYAEQLAMTGYCDIICFLDKNYSEKKDLPAPVLPPRKIREIEGYSHVVIALASERHAEEAKTLLLGLGVATNRILFFADGEDESDSAVFFYHLCQNDILRYPYCLVNVELTNHCVMNCPMCPRTHAMTRGRGYMDLGLFRSIADQYGNDNPRAGASVFWVHHFGESLLHPAFDEAIAYARQRGLRPGISLNPFALSPEKARRLFQAGPSCVYFVVDGYDEESFYTFRGVRDAFERTVEGTLIGIKAKEAYSPDTCLEIVVIDIPAKRDFVDRICEYWRERHGIALLRKPFTTWNGSVTSINSMRGCKAAHAPTCVTPWQSMSINWDGTVIPCCSDYDKLEVLGNANTEALADIWNGESMQFLRRQLRTGVISSGLCGTCEYTFHKPACEGRILSFSLAVDLSS